MWVSISSPSTEPRSITGKFLLIPYSRHVLRIRVIIANILSIWIKFIVLHLTFTGGFGNLHFRGFQIGTTISLRDIRFKRIFAFSRFNNTYFHTETTPVSYKRKFLTIFRDLVSIPFTLASSSNRIINDKPSRLIIKLFNRHKSTDGSEVLHFSNPRSFLDWIFTSRRRSSDTGTKPLI